MNEELERVEKSCNSFATLASQRQLALVKAEKERDEAQVKVAELERDLAQIDPERLAEQRDEARKERDEALAKCRHMRLAIEQALYHYEMHFSEVDSCCCERSLRDALESNLGKGFRSPEEYAALEAKLKEAQLPTVEHIQAIYKITALESKLANSIPVEELDKTIADLIKLWGEMCLAGETTHAMDLRSLINVLESLRKAHQCKS